MASETLEGSRPGQAPGAGTVFCAMCKNVASTPGAKFCTSCGWPLVQPCPYGCGNEALPLLTQGEHTKVCPNCSQVLKHCVACGRLHASSERKCLNDCEAALVFPFDIWSGSNGSSWGTASVARPDFAPSTKNPAASLNLQSGALVGPVATAGYLFTAHEGLLRRWKLGDDRERTLAVGPQNGPHALVAGEDTAYFAAKDELVVVDANGLTATQRLAGQVVAHVASREGWYGLVRAGNHLKLKMIVGRGVLEYDSPIPENDVLGLYGSPGPILLAGLSGVLTSFDASGPIRTLNLGQSIALAWCDEIKAYALDRTGRLHTLDRRTLEITHQFPLLSESPTCAPIFCGDTGYLFHGEHGYTRFDKHSGERQERSHGLGRVTQACSVCTQTGTYAVINSVEGSNQSVQCFNLEGGARVADFFSTHRDFSLRFAIAEQHIHVAVSMPGDVRIRSYALS